MLGKLIVIEGTDCSGKATQAELLMKHLKQDGYEVVEFSFPAYDSPTGKIIGGPYLGKEYIGGCWFKEGATNVDAEVSCLYYAADRRYNIPKINAWLAEGKIVLLDRYTYSNMAHQGGKLKTSEERSKLFSWIDKLEFEMLNLPKPDIRVFLHMPYESATILRALRAEAPDQFESDENHLRNAEMTYLEVADRYQFQTIECSQENIPKSIDSIQLELYTYVKSYLS